MHLRSQIKVLKAYMNNRKLIYIKTQELQCLHQHMWKQSTTIFKSKIKTKYQEFFAI